MRAPQANCDKVRKSNMSKESTAKTRDLTFKSGCGSKIIAAAKSAHLETAKSKVNKVVHSKATRLHRVNAQDSVTGGTKANDKVGVNKCNRLGNGKENVTSQRPNTGVGGTVQQVQIVTKQKSIVPKVNKVVHSKAMRLHRVNAQDSVTGGTKANDKVGVNKYNGLGNGKENVMSQGPNTGAGGTVQQVQIVTEQKSTVPKVNKVVHSKARRLHRVNAQDSVTGGTKANDKVGVNKCNRLGNGKENVTSQRPNTGAGGMVQQVQIVTEQKSIVPKVNKVVHSKARRLHRVNAQDSVTGGTKANDKVGVNKYNRLGNGKENVTSQRPNTGAGGMVQQVQIVTEQKSIVPKVNKVVHSKARRLHRVNAQDSVTGGAKANDKVGVNKYNRLGNGRENVTSRRPNTGAGGMVQQVQIVTEQKSIVPKTQDLEIAENIDTVVAPPRKSVVEPVNQWAFLPKLLTILKDSDQTDDKQSEDVGDDDDDKKGMKWELPGLQQPKVSETLISSSSFFPSDFFVTSESLGLDSHVSSSLDGSHGSFTISNMTSGGGHRSRRNSSESSGTFGGSRWKKKQLKATYQKPFKLRTEERGRYKEEVFVKKLQQMMMEEEKQRIPIAQGLPWTTDEPECLVKPAVKEITGPVDLVLHSDVRAVKRAEFDQQKMSLVEQYRKKRERQQKLAEEEEIRRLRKELIPRAQLMPYFDRPFIPRRSMKHCTIPKEPKFHIPPQHKKIKCGMC
ncbi:Protein TPX2 [Camellia lanceoleosa]|uniref:Protein TPX2 n=1 Tax=Camellia lanceoleosa TaxID=1840588 RepID=A0ACC0GX57_9ERIC|nr:Protein TPX2 [Camellia lanceoleosa]